MPYSRKQMDLILAIPFVLMWTFADTRKAVGYLPFNATRAAQYGIAAYRSALTLDWLAAEDNRQRELVAAIESQPTAPSKDVNTDCIAYPRPSAGSIARLMLEMLRNLEGDNGELIPDLIQALIRTKLLKLEMSVFDNEPDFEALVKTPVELVGEPHVTFPRVIAIAWMAVTDPGTVKKHGWCTINRISKYLNSARPADIAKYIRTVEPIVARARYIMEEFIQHITPLNMMEKSSTTMAATTKYKLPSKVYQYQFKPNIVNTINETFTTSEQSVVKLRPSRAPAPLPPPPPDIRPVAIAYRTMNSPVVPAQDQIIDVANLTSTTSFKELLDYDALFAVGGAYNLKFCKSLFVLFPVLVIVL